jgi:hypothetical protein
MTLTTLQNIQENHKKIMHVLSGIKYLVTARVSYDIMKSDETFILLSVMDYLTEQDTKLIYDNAMTILAITAVTEPKEKSTLLNIKLSYPFPNPFTHSQTYQSKYLFIKDGESCDLVFLKYSETRVGDALGSDYPGNKDQIYSVFFVVVNLSNGNQQQVWTVDASFQEEVLDWLT